MKKLFFIGLLLSLTTLTFGQGKTKVVESYKRHDQSGSPFFRWYWHLRGLSTTIWIESLQLTDDNKFVHYTSTECLPSWTYGTWEKQNNILCLKPDSTVGKIFPDSTAYQFIISNRKLYYSQDAIQNKKWVMKKN
jgi:hypothetical protein